MASGLVSQTNIVRGATVLFNTTFYDAFKNVNIPTSAFVQVDFPNPDGSRGSMQLPMTNPNPGQTNFTAYMDTRNMGTGPVNWSIHSATPVPVAVEDGTFVLTANPANLVTF